MRVWGARAAGSVGSLSDETLMARYAGGEGEAFEVLFERYERRAYAYFLRRTGSPERAQDLYQELFLRVHQARERFEPTRPFTPWLFQIAARLLVDDHRRAFRSREVPIDGCEVASRQRMAERVVGDREQVDRLLGGLSAEERFVVLSAKVEGRGYAELAEQLGKSVEAVRKMASRALRRLEGSQPLDLPAGLAPR